MRLPAAFRSALWPGMALVILLSLAVLAAGIAAEGTPDPAAVPIFPPPSYAAWAALPAHPRLFATPEKWASLKQQIATDPVSKKLFGLIRGRAGNLLTLPSLDFPAKGVNLHGKLNHVGKAG